MGLDMFLEGEKHLPRDFNDPEKNVKEDGFRLVSKKLDLAYWRKHPNLHGFIVQKFNNGEDDCRPILLSEEDIQQIIDAIRNESLPHTEGFFFGASDQSEDQKKEDIEIFTKAVEWLRRSKDGEFRNVWYIASW